MSNMRMPTKHRGGELLISPGMEPATPLWQRVPTRDEHGCPVSDFMMLIPGLKGWPTHRQQKVLEDMATVLHAYGDAVLFVECNLKLNLLWVSVRAIPGICLEIAAALHFVVPQAKLVSQRADS